MKSFTGIRQIGRKAKWIDDLLLTTRVSLQSDLLWVTVVLVLVTGSFGSLEYQYCPLW